MQTLSIKGREERVKGDGSDDIICAFTRDRVEESLQLARDEDRVIDNICSGKLFHNSIVSAHKSSIEAVVGKYIFVPFMTGTVRI